jgi:hypothetical protein
MAFVHSEFLSTWCPRPRFRIFASSAKRNDTLSKRTAKRAGHYFFIARNCDGGYFAWVSQLDRGDIYPVETFGRL